MQALDDEERVFRWVVPDHHSSRTYKISECGTYACETADMLLSKCIEKLRTVSKE